MLLLLIHKILIERYWFFFCGIPTILLLRTNVPWHTSSKVLQQFKIKFSFYNFVKFIFFIDYNRLYTGWKRKTPLYRNDSWKYKGRIVEHELNYSKTTVIYYMTVTAAVLSGKIWKLFTLSCKICQIATTV